MSLPARAAATPAGHPVLKLVLLTVAALPGYPTVKDVAAASELTEPMAEDALTDLVAARLLTRHRSPAGRLPQYALPDDGWTYTRADSDDDPPPVSAPAPQFDGLGVALGKRVLA